MLLDLKQCLKDASVKGHLCLTVPWVVQYLSMMDPQAARMTVCRSTLNTTTDIYKYVYTYLSCRTVMRLGLHIFILYMCTYIQLRVDLCVCSRGVVKL